MENNDQNKGTQISDEELQKQISIVVEQYTGQIDDLYQAVGMIVVGRLFGWRVMRLASSRRCWTKATQLFGDPKELMPARTSLSRKSVGLSVIDAVGGYWDFIKGKTQAMPLEDRKMISDDVVAVAKISQPI